jgi:hypothetical protein
MTRRAASILALACLLTTGGCYENVVSAKGFGGDQTPVARANVPRESDRISGYKKIDHKPIP